MKFIVPDSERSARRFIAEARATAACEHDNIVVIHEVDAYKGLPYMVLEYLEGQTLRDYLGRRAVTPARAVELIVPVVRALVCAHGHGIVHRDLKLANVQFSSTGVIKVLDFGLAKVLEREIKLSAEVTIALRQEQSAASVPASDVKESMGQELSLTKPPDVGADATKDSPLAFETTSDGEALPAGLDNMLGRAQSPASDAALTKPGSLMGTPAFMSPEQFRGEVDEQSDIWSVGVMLFLMLTGEHPFPLRSIGDIAMELLDLDKPLPRSLDRLAKNVPTGLRSVIERCLAKRKEQRFADAASLLAALEPLLPAHGGRMLEAGESPFPGLFAFREGDANRFFGREHTVRRAVQRLMSQPLLGIVGSSGVGKTSLVHAGLVPALRASGESWDILLMRPGRTPLLTLANAIAGLSSAAERSDADSQAVADALLSSPGLLGRKLREHAHERQCRVLLFLDQFEELYTLVSDVVVRRAFTHAILGAADDPAAPIRVVIAMRADMLDRLVDDQHFADDVIRSLLLLAPPARQELRRALTEPLNMVGHRFEDPEMVDEMLDQLEDTPGALPLLQFTAAKLWEVRDAKACVLTRVGYQTIGGVGGALAAHADEVLARLPGPQQRLVREIFVRAITPERTRAVVDLDELETLGRPEVVRRLVDHLAQSRLLAVQRREEKQTVVVEIVHETLITSWPTLRRWLDESSEDAEFFEQLRIAAKHWDEGRRKAGLLWRGEAAEDAIHFSKRTSRAIAGRERAFLDAVLAADVRVVRRRRWAIAGVIGLLSVLLMGSMTALISVREAQKKTAREAERADKQGLGEPVCRLPRRKSRPGGRAPRPNAPTSWRARPRPRPSALDALPSELKNRPSAPIIKRTGRAKRRRERFWPNSARVVRKPAPAYGRCKRAKLDSGFVR
jgi:serine/threonine protein kinase